MVTSTTPAGAATTYTYDATGLRATKTPPSAPTQTMTWDPITGTVPLLLNDTTTHYLYGPGDTPIEQIRGTTPTWLHGDRLDSTRLITTTTGTIADTYTYNPYGRTTAHTGTTTTALQYNGQYTDTETGFIYLRTRYYDPTTAQFTTLDPLFTVTRARYSYALGNPLTNTDPAGLDAIDTTGTFLTGVADEVSMGLGPVARRLLGINWQACNETAYHSGQATGFAISLIGAEVKVVATGARGAIIAERAAAETGADAAGAAARACFVAGTQVLMADGTRKAIEDVKVGDKVASRNVTTGKGENRTVTRTFVHHDVALYEVKVDGGKVTTTADHLFYIHGKGWTAVKDLRPGDQLDQPEGTTVAVEAVIDTGRTATVYNFEVETAHNYYVQAGTHWVLVHNDCRGLWQITKEGTAATKNGPFGKLWKSKSDGLWWSRDTAGHGGSAWKVFDETPKGLQWRADADQYGNAGCLKPLHVIVPEGCMLNPRPPAAVVAGNVETSQLRHQCAVRCARRDGRQPLHDEQLHLRQRTRYQYYETISGGCGAGVVKDGAGHVVGGFDGTAVVQTHMTNSRLTDPEVLEFRFPVRLDSYEIRRGSGGAGRWRGGDGGVRRVRFLEPMTASILSNGRVVPAFGMAGGAPGAVGINRVERRDGSVETLGHIGSAQMQPGDVFVIETPGGGGYGEPA